MTTLAQIISLTVMGALAMSLQVVMEIENTHNFDDSLCLPVRCLFSV